MKKTQTTRHNGNSVFRSFAMACVLSLASTTAVWAQDVSGYWQTSDGDLLILQGEIETGVSGLASTPGETGFSLLFGVGSEGSATLEGILGLNSVDINVEGDVMNGVFRQGEKSLPFVAERTTTIVPSPLNGFWLFQYENGDQSIVFAVTTGDNLSSLIEIDFGPNRFGFHDLYLAVAEESNFSAFGIFGFQALGVDFYDSESMNGAKFTLFTETGFTAQKLF